MTTDILLWIGALLAAIYCVHWSGKEQDNYLREALAPWLEELDDE